MRKTSMLAFVDGCEFEIGPSECGQIVVKLTPEEWDRLDDVQKETVVLVDILLAAEWAKEHTFVKTSEGWHLWV